MAGAVTDAAGEAGGGVVGCGGWTEWEWWRRVDSAVADAAAEARVGMGVGGLNWVMMHVQTQHLKQVRGRRGIKLSDDAVFEASWRERKGGLNRVVTQGCCYCCRCRRSSWSKGSWGRGEWNWVMMQGDWLLQKRLQGDWLLQTQRLKQREWAGMELNDDTGRLADAFAAFETRKRGVQVELNDDRGWLAVADAAAEAADPEGKWRAAAGDGGVAAAGAVHAGGEQKQPAEEPEDAGHGLPPAWPAQRWHRCAPPFLSAPVVFRPVYSEAEL